MSKSRTLLSRPRTKVYESNYNIGQNYYKSAIDGLDRKYGRGSSEPTSNSGLAALRAALDSPERTERTELPRPTIRDLEDEDIFSELPRRKTNTAALLGEFDSIFETRFKNGAPRERNVIEDDVEEDISASLKRLRASRAARAAAEDLEEIESNLSTKRGSSIRAKLDFSDKLIESVGLTGKSRQSLEEDFGKKRILKVTEGASDDGALMKWTAVKSGTGRRHILDGEEEESSGQIAAAARARKSRARLEDLEAEMQALSERGAAREKRVRDLKALVQENETSSKESLHSAVRVKTSIQSEKKVVSF